MGPNPSRDGTRPFSSFFRRQVFVAGLFVLLLVGTICHATQLAPCLVLFVLDLAWLVHLFRRDRHTIRKDCLAERDLTGSSPDWFPEADE